MIKDIKKQKDTALREVELIFNDKLLKLNELNQNLIKTHSQKMENLNNQQVINLKLIEESNKKIEESNKKIEVLLNQIDKSNIINNEINTKNMDLNNLHKLLTDK